MCTVVSPARKQASQPGTPNPGALPAVMHLSRIGPTVPGHVLLSGAASHNRAVISLGHRPEGPRSLSMCLISLSEPSS